SSNEASAQAFLREHAGAMPDAVHQEISGHPTGLWADLQSFLKGAAAATADAPEDTRRVAVLQKTFSSFGINGGEMKDGANEYRLSLRLMDKQENSLLQLLRMAQQLAPSDGEAASSTTMR